MGKLIQRHRHSSSHRVSIIHRHWTHHLVPTLRSQSHSNYEYLLAMSAALTVTMSASILSQSENFKVKACGIMGMITDEEQVIDYLLEGLTILQNRGYDSAGIATIDQKEEGS